MKIVWLVLLSMLMTVGADAELWECPNSSSTIILEHPLGSDCKKLDIQTPPPITMPLTPGGFREYGAWPDVPPDTQTRTCQLYNEWHMLTLKGTSLPIDEVQRRLNLDQIFNGRPAPPCEGR